jgi:hypothetical protein
MFLTRELIDHLASRDAFEVKARHAVAGANNDVVDPSGYATTCAS